MSSAYVYMDSKTISRGQTAFTGSVQGVGCITEVDVGVKSVKPGLHSKTDRRAFPSVHLGGRQRVEALAVLHCRVTLCSVVTALWMYLVNCVG